MLFWFDIYNFVDLLSFLCPMGTKVNKVFSVCISTSLSALYVKCNGLECIRYSYICLHFINFDRPI